MKEKEDKNIILTIILVLAAALAVGIGLWFLNTARVVYKGFKEVQQIRVQLLCQTDHQALLEACNELSGMVDRGELKSGLYIIRKNPAPETARFPQLIIKLKPNYVYIDENDSGRVMLEMYGGLYHYGIMAYTEDYEKPFSGFTYGDRKLIDRLWYYDDGYDNPEYDKSIDELIQKNSNE